MGTARDGSSTVHGTRVHTHSTGLFTITTIVRYSCHVYCSNCIVVVREADRFFPFHRSATDTPVFLSLSQDDLR